MLKKTTLFLLLLSISFSSYSGIVKKKDFIIGGAVVSIAVAYQYYLKNPDKLSDFVSSNPEGAKILYGYSLTRKETTKNEKKKAVFENFNETLAFELGILKTRAEEIEVTPEWLKIYSEVLSKAEAIDQEMTKNNLQCNTTQLKLLFLKNSDFENTVNKLLPKIQNYPTHTLNVNTYRYLYKNYTNKSFNLEHDHIPSKAAIREFLENKGITIKSINYENKINNKNKISNNDLIYNESAISIPKLLHSESRTYAGRNSSKQITKDSNNLRLATIKDLTTIAYYLYLNENDIYNQNKFGIHYSDYINSGIILYTRNKLLCLYD